MADQNFSIKVEPGETLAMGLRRLMLENKMTEAELARKTEIPQATLHKILTGRTTDPRTSTLKILADYFNVSIDNLMNRPMMASNHGQTQNLAIISWQECIKGMGFIKTLTPSNWNCWIVTEFISTNAYALISKPSMEPRFPKKTTLIIDPEIKPEDGDIIVVFYPNTEEATLRELCIDGPTKLLLPLSESSNPTVYENEILILGVLVKSSFSYHS